VINAVFPRDSCWDETHCRGGVHSRPDERSLDDRRLDVVRRGEKRNQAARLDRRAFPGVASAGRRVGRGIPQVAKWPQLRDGRDSQTQGKPGFRPRHARAVSACR